MRKIGSTAPDEITWAEPERQTRAVKEYLAALEAESEPNPDRKLPKVVSPSDPCSAWTAKANKRIQFGYGLNYLIDIDNADIVDVEPTPGRTYDEVESTKTMHGLRDLFSQKYPTARELAEQHIVDASLIDELEQSGFIARCTVDASTSDTA